MVAIARTPSHVAELLLRGAATTPDAVCLIDPESGLTLTFRELRDRVASFASRLDAAGLKPGERICVVLENGIAAVVSQLGIMSGGFIAVPIDPGGGAARIGGVLDHCQASAVVVGSERRGQIAEVITGLDRDLPLLHPDEAATGIEPGKALARPVCAADDALLMYTSGTTARPKGVLLSHADLMHRAAVLVEPHGLTTADRLLVIVDTFLKGAHRRRPLPWLMFRLRRIVQRGSIRRRGDSLGDDHGLGEPTAMDQRAMTAYREAAFRRSLTRRYQPRPYRGDILLFRGTRSLIPPHLRLDATLGWRRVARGRLLVHDIEAGHFEILDEHAAAVAEVLRNHLSRHRGGETASDASARRHPGPQDTGVQQGSSSPF